MSAELWLKLLSYCHVLFSEYCMLHTYQITVLGCLNAYFVGGAVPESVNAHTHNIKNKNKKHNIVEFG